VREDRPARAQSRECWVGAVPVGQITPSVWCRMTIALLLLVGCTSPQTDYKIRDLQDRVEFLEAEVKHLRADHVVLRDEQDILTGQLVGCLDTLKRIDSHYEAIRHKLGDD